MRRDEKGFRLFRSPLAHFLLAGLLLFVGRMAWNTLPETPLIEIRRSEIDESIAAFERGIGRTSTEAEMRAIENRLIENALWLEQAWAFDLHESDPVVRQRLLRNMRFLDSDSDLPDAELVRRAFDLGMQRSDTVVRRRLIERMQALVRAGVRSRSPDDETLRSHFQETASRWREPTLLDLSHVYLSRDKRGAATRGDAVELLALLVDQGLTPDAAALRGDPFLSGHRMRRATESQIAARLGPDFAVAIEDAETLRWVGPVDSVFGIHLVWLHERIQPRLPAFEEIRGSVLEDWFENESRSSIRRAIAHYRQSAEVRIIEDRASVTRAVAPSEFPRVER